MLGLLEMTAWAAYEVAANAVWMGWNIVLALVPLALAVRLFRGRRAVAAERRPAWWAGLALFVLFLPNAPYVLTDVIHLYTDVRSVQSDAVLSFAVLPQYALFMTAGVAAYIASVLLAEGYVRAAWPRLGRWVRPMAHAGSAVGIYLGRFVRLNSWDVVVRPAAVVRAVVDTFSLRGVVLLGLAFALLTLVTDAAAWAWGEWRSVRAWRRAA